MLSLRRRSLRTYCRNSRGRFLHPSALTVDAQTAATYLIHATPHNPSYQLAIGMIVCRRQREYMEGTIAALKVQLKKASKQAHTQQTRDLQVQLASASP